MTIRGDETVRLGFRDPMRLIWAIGVTAYVGWLYHTGVHFDDRINSANRWLLAAALVSVPLFVISEMLMWLNSGIALEADRITFFDAFGRSRSVALSAETSFTPQVRGRTQAYCLEAPGSEAVWVSSDSELIHLVGTRVMGSGGWSAYALPPDLIKGPATMGGVSAETAAANAVRRRRMIRSVVLTAAGQAGIFALIEMIILQPDFRTTAWMFLLCFLVFASMNGELTKVRHFVDNEGFGAMTYLGGVKDYIAFRDIESAERVDSPDGTWLAVHVNGGTIMVDMDSLATLDLVRKIERA